MINQTMTMTMAMTMTMTLIFRVVRVLLNVSMEEY
jgi:hypothetical protein